MRCTRQLLADMLRDKGHDVRAVAASAELAGADDATVLGPATADGRCLLTENVRDFAVPRGWVARMRSWFK